MNTPKKNVKIIGQVFDVLASAKTVDEIDVGVYAVMRNAGLRIAEARDVSGFVATCAFLNDMNIGKVAEYVVPFITGYMTAYNPRGDNE